MIQIKYFLDTLGEAHPFDVHLWLIAPFEQDFIIFINALKKGVEKSYLDKILDPYSVPAERV